MRNCPTHLPPAACKLGALPSLQRFTRTLYLADAPSELAHAARQSLARRDTLAAQPLMQGRTAPHWRLTLLEAPTGEGGGEGRDGGHDDRRVALMQ